MKMVPAPSPRGSNYARVFVPASWRPAVAAYDAAPSEAKPTPLYTDEEIQRIMAMFEGKLEADDLRFIEQLLRPDKQDDHLAGDDNGETSKFVKGKLSPEDFASYDAFRRKAFDARRAKDNAGPPPFPGRPTPGGAPLRTAQDAHPLPVRALAARIKVVW